MLLPLLPLCWLPMLLHLLPMLLLHLQHELLLLLLLGIDVPAPPVGVAAELAANCHGEANHCQRLVLCLVSKRLLAPTDSDILIPPSEVHSFYVVGGSPVRMLS